MRQLASALAFLDKDMKESGTLRRLWPQDFFLGICVCEADYDELSVGQLASVADCLREAALIAEHHALLHIGMWKTSTSCAPKSISNQGLSGGSSSSRQAVPQSGVTCRLSSDQSLLDNGPL